MANIKSQKDRIVTNEKARLLNKAKKSRIATETKKFREFLAAGKVKEAEVQLKEVISLIDKARLDNVYHSNTASRKVAALSKQLSTAKGGK
ncbi:MAG: 30S ribosomal protein S20 [Firmicutes bacterium]|nr:30S ribosomal protein S20 [Bacillota bacterium]